MPKPLISVALTLEQWQDVLKALEFGVDECDNDDGTRGPNLMQAWDTLQGEISKTLVDRGS
jgi:hypothetical protein